MSDLRVSGGYLDSLRAQFTELAALTSTDGDPPVDHSSCGSSAVAGAGNYASTLQRSRAAISSGNAVILGAHAGTTSAEIEALDASLARAAEGK